METGSGGGGGGAHLFPSLMPLRAVVPSLLTNRRRLLSENTHAELNQRDKRPTEATSSPGNYRTFAVVDVFKVLASDNFFHDVVSIHPGVVDPGGVVLHRVLLPPGTKP